MARKNFYELLKEMKFDYNVEYKNLYQLIFVEKSIVTGYYCITFSEYIDNSCFRNFKYRGSFISFSQMMNSLFPRFPQIASFDDLLLFCEVILSIIKDRQREFNDYAKEQGKTILDNIEYICEKANYDIVEREDHEFIILEKNKEAKHASELVDDTSIAFEILEYNHYALHGNVEEKKKILLNLGNYIEPTLKSHYLKNNGYGKLESDVGFLLNNFHIRHNNKEGPKSQEYIVGLNDFDLEKWYDKCYNSILSVIIVKEQVEINKELTELKSEYTWKS